MAGRFLKYKKIEEAGAFSAYARVEEAPPTAQTEPLTLEQHTTEALESIGLSGFDPALEGKRAALLPMAKTPAGETVLAAPQILQDVTESLMTPGAARRGVPITPRDTTRMALDVSGMRGLQGAVKGGARISAKLGGPRADISLPPGKSARKLIKEAPTSESLKQGYRDIFKGLKARGIVIPNVHGKQLVANIAAKWKDKGGSAALGKKGGRLLDEWGQKIEDGADIPFTDLEIMRKQAVILGRSPEPSDGILSGIMKDNIDTYMDKLPSGTLPRKARDMWRRHIKVSEFDEIFYHAELNQTGFEKGVVSGFRTLLKNKRRVANFSAAEVRQMERVVKGGSVQKFMKWASRFGPGRGIVAPAVGGGVGYAAGGAPGAAAVLAGGSLAGMGAKASTTRSAKLAQAMAATGGQLDPETMMKILGRQIGGPLLGTQMPKVFGETLTEEQQRRVNRGDII